MADAANDAAAVPQQFRSQFLQFVKTLASFTGDLSQLTCPAFLLSGTSLLEYSQHWADHPTLFTAITTPADDAVAADVDAERMVAVLRWFFAYLHGSFYSRAAAGEKKPFNPVLGELYRCAWSNGATRMLCEQVSHHPPIGAFCIENREMGIVLNGHCGQNTKFKTTSINVQQTGRAVLTIYNGPLPSSGTDASSTTTTTEKMPDVVDEYFIALPEMVLRGLLTGHMFVEMVGATRITSASGYTAHIEYLPKPWFGGDYHFVKGTITHSSDEKRALYEISGKWTETSYVSQILLPVATTSTSTLTSPVSATSSTKSQHKKSNEMLKLASSPSSSSSSGKTSPTSAPKVILFDPITMPAVPPTLKPLDQRFELECTRLWHPVSEALQNGDHSIATREKSTIEEQQRTLRKTRAEENDKWTPTYFKWCSDSADNGSGNSSVEGSNEHIDDGQSRYSKQDDPDQQEEFVDARSDSTSKEVKDKHRSMATLAHLTAHKDNNKNLDHGMWKFKKGSIPW